MRRQESPGRSIVAVSICALLAGACRNAAQQDPEVLVRPDAVTLSAGGRQAFLATGAATGTSVTWSIVEGAAGGAITTQGVYTAPMSSGTFHVSATSLSDPTKGATATVTVQQPAVAIAINPTTASVSGCNSTTFSATVTNTANTAVRWSVQEGSAGGTVDTAGRYTAPTTPGTYHVVATSQADPTRTSVATVTVATQVMGVAVTPGAPTVQTGGTITFTATVTTTCGQFTATQIVASNQ
jgi:hypothetical protein